ncbi:hypothetical protein EDC04DRAFT_3008298 [Pisolithus marmoratus]|nr:hypothetical protein EDC04DRAFT_3008298 [Pisolithus marmoratus]
MDDVFDELDGSGSHTGCPDTQPSSLFLSNSLSESYNSSSNGSNNFFACNNVQGPASFPAPNSLSWVNGSQMAGNSSYAFPHSQGPAEKIPNVQVLQEMINGLQKENIALKAERSAMQNAYNTLVSRLTVHQSDPIASEGPVDVTLQSAPIATMSLFNTPPVLQLNRVDYPRVRFWFEKDWKGFRMTAEGQECSATAFIEDENGQELASEKISNILQTMRSIWHELRSHGQINAQTTWSSMSFQVKKVFRGELVQMCPELNFCEDSWKSDLLAKKHYSSFKQTWFTNKSDEKLNSTTKRKAKSEVVEDADSPTRLSNTKCTKINAFTGSYDTSGDGNVSTDWPSLESNESSLSSGSKVSAGASGLSSAVEEERANVVAPPLIKNPLSSLRATAPPTVSASPEPITRTLERSTSSSNEHTGAVNEESQVETPNTSHTASVSQPSVQQTAPGPVDVSGKKKTWRPPSNKSGRTLCMHRYQKQVGGSLDEFNGYFEALSPGAKVKYKDEAKDLAGEGGEKGRPRGWFTGRRTSSGGGARAGQIAITGSHLVGYPDIDGHRTLEHETGSKPDYVILWKTTE